LNIPAKFRKVLDPVNDRTFVITRGFDQCLVLYPLQDWSQVEEQLSKLSSIRGRHRSFVRSVTRYATSVQYDGQGRIQIPESLLSYSAINKEVAVIGMINKIELWDPAIISQMDANEEGMKENNFDDLANEINF
jgi:MraZ protein